MRKVYSVSQINRYIRNMFSEDYFLQAVLVRGEVSNCKYHSSGHIYFTLKDASGTLSCIMFASRRRGLSFRMKDGDQVIVSGGIDVYENAGRYQLYAQQIIMDGVGALNERYEQLKKRLEESGMFDEIYKKPIPAYIRTLGVVTASTGAAVQDIMNITRRRNPYVQIILYPAIVQGEDAPDSIVDGIRRLDSLGCVDTIIIGRGGGSIEDLWAFNEERVAEAVFACRTPIISAVGHETDTVITDYVADLRAPTPSAAAELAVFAYDQFESELAGMERQLTDAMRGRTAFTRRQAESLKRELVHLSPAMQIRDRRMRAVQLEEKLQMSMENRIAQARRNADLMEPLKERMDKRLVRDRHRLQLMAAGLEQASPVRRLSGGYGFVSDDEGRAVTSAFAVEPGDLITVRFKDGGVDARVERVPDIESDLASDLAADRERNHE